MLGSAPAVMLGVTGGKRSEGTYQAQHEIKSDRLQLFSLEKQNGRDLADFLSYVLYRAQELSTVAPAAGLWKPS